MWRETKRQALNHWLRSNLQNPNSRVDKELVSVVSTVVGIGIGTTRHVTGLREYDQYGNTRICPFNLLSGSVARWVPGTKQTYFLALSTVSLVTYLTDHRRLWAGTFRYSYLLRVAC